MSNTAAHYVKKPVVVHAIQFDGTNVDLIKDFCGSQPLRLDIPETIVIPTLEGDMVAKIGDYIIRGVKGELYPCKPDIFTETYKPVP